MSDAIIIVNSDDSMTNAQSFIFVTLDTLASLYL